MQITRRTFIAGVAASGLWPCSVQAAAPAAPAVLLAKVADGAIDPSPYLVSEKYDGVRALWDGRRLRFRSGRELRAPAWFTRALPQQALDGELWLARRQFDLLSGIVRKSDPIDSEWRQLRYMVFELPGGEGPFVQRHAQLRRIVEHANWPALQAVEQLRIDDSAALQRALAQVVRGGGEGLMLHRADAPYVTGRSDMLLKLKPLHDEEAIVVAHVAGKGKYAGMTGALELQMSTGLRFRVGAGLSDDMRRHPPTVGATVTFVYRELTPTGVPRFASYSRVREEL
jgi:DNA ligase 1